MQSKIFHIALVSKQTMPVIIPALHLKPDKVILVATPEEKSSAFNIKKVLNDNNISCELSGNLINAYDYNSTADEIKKIINSFHNQTLILNITGGTKLMAIAAYESFRKANLETIYCDTSDNKIISFKYGNIRSENINVSVSVKDYLSSYGFDYSISADKIKRFNENLPLLEFISQNLNEFLDFLEYFKPNYKNDTKNQSIIHDNFELETNYCKYSLSYKNSEIFSSDIRNINYIIGYWLEDYTYMKLKQKNLDDIVIGADVHSGMNNPNEIDILFTKNARLHLVSCKAGKTDKQDLFELDGLRDLAGGTFGIAHKVITNKMSNSFINRAKELKINIINIKKLDSFNI